MSTNDSLAILANGAAGGKLLDKTDDSEDFEAMKTMLGGFLQELSHLVVRDGEGATKFVRVRVINSHNRKDANSIAMSIARDNLVKTALYGKDANWGRILCAIGYARISCQESVVPEKISVSFVPTDGSEILKLVVNGEPDDIDEARAAQILEHEDLEILVDLGGGKDGKNAHEASYWFCDLSHEYGELPLLKPSID